MNLRYRLAQAVAGVSISRPQNVPVTAGNCSLPNASQLAAARGRLKSARQRSQRHKIPASEGYYGERKQLEETVHELHSAHACDAVVTRNHYGSLVLNAGSTLFIDVDVAQPGRMARFFKRFGRRVHSPWRRMLDDLSTVLAGEFDEGFRIYRTAAGFRILATTREHQPDSRETKRLMNLVGADAIFMDLCQMQNNFRARLTPKPWRCGARRLPNAFPRQSPDEQQRFNEWLSHYEYACRDHATCQFLEHVGPDAAHARVQPIIELHDRETKAFESLPLA